MPLSLPQAGSLCALFADPTRVRLMALLDRSELSVAELTSATDLGQSRVSTHLGKLRDAGLVRDRRHGASTYYRLSDPLPETADRLWRLLRKDLDDGVLASDRERGDALVATRSSGWPESVAGRMERHYSPGRTWEATAQGVVGLSRFGDVLDAGSGDGALASLIAPSARSVTCLDRSEQVLAAARRRLGAEPHVRFSQGDLLELPFEPATFDQVMLFNVLTCTTEPAQALFESARVLRPGGHVAGVTLRKHRHMDVASEYGHQLPGFEPAELSAMFEELGLTVRRCAVTSRERRRPYFEVITFSAQKA